jgi:hypothetical protein
MEELIRNLLELQTLEFSETQADNAAALITELRGKIPPCSCATVAGAISICPTKRKARHRPISGPRSPSAPPGDGGKAAPRLTA